MPPPFPGMDPWLEHPALWPDVHNRLLAALADDLTPRVAPRYYVALERATYLLSPDDLVLVGRPDLALVSRDVPQARSPRTPVHSGSAVVEVEVPVSEEVGENYLELRDVAGGLAVTVIELLSPANKLHPRGRAEYEAKRARMLRSMSHLIELQQEAF